MSKQDEAPLVQEEGVLMHLLALLCIPASCYCWSYPELRLAYAREVFLVLVVCIISFL